MTVVSFNLICDLSTLGGANGDGGGGTDSWASAPLQVKSKIAADRATYVARYLNIIPPRDGIIPNETMPGKTSGDGFSEMAIAGRHGDFSVRQSEDGAGACLHPPDPGERPVQAGRRGEGDLIIIAR